MKDKVIGPGKPKGVSKNLQERRIRKIVEDAQGKQMGQGCPRGNKWDTGARKQCNKKPNDYTKSLSEEQAAG